jgi:hypothetical protein
MTLGCEVSEVIEEQDNCGLGISWNVTAIFVQRRWCFDLNCVMGVDLMIENE